MLVTCTFTGVADLAVKDVSADQLRKMAFPTAPRDAVGMLYMTAPVRACRTSKSDGPRSALMLITTPGGLKPESLEAMSSDLDQVYDASACRPRESRRWNWSC